MKNRFTYVVILISALVASRVAYTESEMEAAKQENQAADSTKKEAPKKSATNKKPLKEFTPSEEISIDNPVAFPVDI